MAHIEKRLTSKGEARYDVRWRLPDGRVRRLKFLRRAEAEAYKRKLEHDELTGVVVDPRRSLMTLTDYANGWLRHRRKANGQPLAPKTRELYRDLLDRYILPKLGSMALVRIRTEDVRRWYGSVTDESSALQAAKAYRLLRSIMATAVADERLATNPCTLRGAGQEHSAERPLVDPATIWKLADAMEPRLRIVVLLAGFVALRRGELFCLRRQDVDLKRMTVTVERQAVHLKAVGRVDSDPKSRAGVRTVAMPAAVARELKGHLELYVGTEPEALVLTGERGGPLSKATLYPAFYEAGATVGCENVTLHDLRHAAGTLAAQHGATTKELMARMGHASPAAALRYQHASERRDAELAARLNTEIGEAEPRKRKSAASSSRHHRRPESTGMGQK